jgi:hypothetical protein
MAKSSLRRSPNFAVNSFQPTQETKLCFWRIPIIWEDHREQPKLNHKNYVYTKRSIQFKPQ